MNYIKYGRELELSQKMDIDLEDITNYLINDNKPDLEEIVLPKSKRPNKWELRKEAFFGKFSLLRYLFPKTKTYVTPEEAIAANPAEMAKTVEYINKIDGKEEPKKAKAKAAAAAGGDDNGSVEEKSSMVLEEESVQNSAIVPSMASVDLSADGTVANGSVMPGESIGTIEQNMKKIKRHGYGSNLKQKMEVGDILPTGHRIKPANAPSMVEQLNQKMAEDDVSKAESGASKRRSRHRR
jgi:hypothetical protein